MVLGMLAVATVGSSKMLGGSRQLAVRTAAQTSILFLLLGAVIGPQGLALIDPQVFDQLGPVVVLGLGWIGFLYGTNLEYRALRRFHPRLFATAFGESLVTMVLVGLTFFALLGGFVGAVDWKAILILATAAAGTAPASLFMLRSYLPIRGPTYELLRFLR